MIIKTISLSFCLLFSFYAEALGNKTKEVTKITYEQYRHAKLLPNKEIVMTFSDGIARLSNTSNIEEYFIDFNIKSAIKVLKFDSEQYKQSTHFSEFAKPKETEETEKILGYLCKKAVFTVFSNKVEVWYTTKTKFKGSPSLSAIVDNALVLKYVVNGSRMLKAKSIDTEKKKAMRPDFSCQEINQARYRELIIKSRFVTVPIFDKEQINFDANYTNPKEEIINHTYHFSKGTVIVKKIMLPKLNANGHIFLTLTNWSNGDAYDRTGCVFTIADDNKKSILAALKNGTEELPVYIDNKGSNYQGVVSTEQYTVPVELMRFFTSFGVGHFNNKRPINSYNWQDSVVYKQEITELIAADKKEIWVGVFIGNYDKGGHKVSLDLNYYPPFGDSPMKEKVIKPLFYTLNVMEASGQNYGRMFKNDTLRMEFNLDSDINDTHLLYTTTGHGGWGNGDEFIPKLNRIFIDDELIFKHVPWRTDCGTYRMSNPASGNFGNGLSSSDLSRSNWCPATLTQPFYIPLNNLKAGKHVVKVIIDQGDDEGNSFNHWSVSGILVGER